MTLYVGETVRITNRAQDFDGAAMTSSDVTSVTIALYDSDLGVIVAETAMTWDAVGDVDGALWFYDWETVGRAAGSYLGKVRVNGPGSHEAFEFITVRLKAPKV